AHVDPVEPEGAQSVGVARWAGGPPQRLGEGHARHRDSLLLPVGRRGAALDRGDALGQVQVEDLVAPPRGGVEAGQEGQGAALDPQLLGQLAAQGVLDRLAVDVVLAGGDLQQPAPDGVAPLVDQDDPAVVVDDQGGHRARAGAPAGVDDPVGPDREHLAPEGAPGLDGPERRRRRVSHRGAPVPGPAGARARRPPAAARARGRPAAPAGTGGGGTGGSSSWRTGSASSSPRRSTVAGGAGAMPGSRGTVAVAGGAPAWAGTDSSALEDRPTPAGRGVA